jgi:hypothetical protein
MPNLYFAPLYVPNIIKDTDYTFHYSVILDRDVTLLQRNFCVLGEKEPMTTLASLEYKPKKSWSQNLSINWQSTTVVIPIVIVIPYYSK